MEYARDIGTDEAIERIEVMNAAILRWTERPIPEKVPYARPKRRIDVYYNGRFYDSEEILNGVQKKFSAHSWEDAFRAAYHHVFAQSGRLSRSAQALQEVMLADAAHGTQVPSFMVAVYLEGKN